jgi:hypothetical protein
LRRHREPLNNVLLITHHSRNSALLSGMTTIIQSFHGSSIRNSPPGSLVTTTKT